MKEHEYIQEGWVKFTRTECKEGFIDVWTGDCIDNPNNKYKNKWNLNGFNTYMRLNGEDKWIKLGRRPVKSFLLDFKDNATAEEIFEVLTPKEWTDEI